MRKLPIVAIVGRANVGKSSLFNRIVGQRQAIVADEAGTTRDNVTSVVDLGKTSFRLVDTAGLKRPEDDFEASIQDQITEAADSADVILVVVEAKTDVTEEDRTVAKLALKSKKNVALLMNKADQAQKVDLKHWDKTGIKKRIATSAIHGDGMSDLEDFLLKSLPSYKQNKNDKTLTIALIGRPNVGKSYLFNSLGKKQQAIVADVAGTTRDLNRVEVKYHGKVIELIDTAGVRRPGKIERGVEHFSILRTMQAIDEADVCLLLMDVNELNVSMDQKLAGIIADSGKGLVLVVSKWDSVDKDSFTHDAIAKGITRHYQHVWWAPLIFTSSVTGQNVTELLDIVTELHTRRQQKLETKDLNLMLGKVISHHPPSAHNIRPKLKYATQTGTEPPTITVFGRNATKTHWSYKRYIEKALRHNWDFSGTPVRIKFQEPKENDRRI